jgi:hypothetical protein
VVEKLLFPVFHNGCPCAGAAHDHGHMLDGGSGKKSQGGNHGWNYKKGAQKSQEPKKASPLAILIAAGVTLVAYVSKFVASWITSRIFHYTRSEFWTVYGLSHAQAAVTIPTLVIGLQIGLFEANLAMARALNVPLAILAERLAASFSGNLIILHFDR